jgi:hypothetical protein
MKNSNVGCVVSIGLIAAVLSPLFIFVELVNSKSVGDAIGLLLLIAVAVGLVVWSRTRN